MRLVMIVMAATVAGCGPALAQQFTPAEADEMAQIAGIGACIPTNNAESDILFLVARLNRIRESFAARHGEAAAAARFNAAFDETERAMRLIADTIPKGFCFNAGRNFQRMRAE